MGKLFQNRIFQICLQALGFILLLAILCYTLWQITTYTVALNSSGVLHRHRRLAISAQPASQSEISQLQSWMAFRYINLIFRLPPAYLQIGLNISDKRYPNISINSLAKQQNKTSSVELLLVRQKIKNYFSAEPSATPTP